MVKVAVTVFMFWVCASFAESPVDSAGIETGSAGLSSVHPADSLLQEKTNVTGVTLSSEEEFIPDPRRIAQERINRMRSPLQGKAEEWKSSAMRITIDEAIQRLVLRNADIRKAQLEFLAGEKMFAASFGIFEPYLVGSNEYSESQRHDAILIELRNTLKTGVEGVLPTGTKYGIFYTDKNVRFAQSSLEIPSVGASVRVTQPILRDFLGNGPLSEIKIRRAERQIAFNRYRSTLMERCFNLERIYWKLVYLQEKRKNAEKSVAVARQISNESRMMVSSGLMSKLDAVEVNSQVAQREMALTNVKLDHLSAMAEFMQMIGFGSDSALIQIVAATPFRETEHTLASETLSKEEVDSILAAGQPEYLAARYNVHRSSIALAQQRGRALPELNLTGLYGISGTHRIHESAFQQFLDPERNKHNWACAVELKVPLGAGIRERNMVKAEQLNHEISELERGKLKNELASLAVMTAEKIHDLGQNLSNARVMVEYRSSLLQSEMVRHRAGLSSIRKIFEMEQELENARESELEMLVDYRLALSLRDRLLGVTLKKRGLETVENGKPVLRNDLVY